MALWTEVECDFDRANETINFGTRTLAEDYALYETTTLAIIRESNKISNNPSVKCKSQNNKIYLAIDNNFRLFSNNCAKLDICTAFSSNIDLFTISSDDNFVLFCLNDGVINCLHISSGGRHIFSTCIEDISSKNSFVSLFSWKDEINNKLIFFISTKNSVYKLKIDNITNLCTDVQNNIENIQVNFNLDCICSTTKSSFTKFKTENDTFCISNNYEKLFFNTGTNLSIGLDENQNLIGICKLTNLMFDIDMETKYKDIIFLNSKNFDKQLLVITETTENSETKNYIKMLSYPNYEPIYSIKVSENTYLVELMTENEELIFIEGFQSNKSEFINELRLKLITESSPQVKLLRYLRHKQFEEAKNFAKLFNLNGQPIFQAEAEEFIIKSDFHLKDFDKFFSILDRINDIKVVTENCLNVSAENLEGIENLLEYANKRIYGYLNNVKLLFAVGLSKEVS